MAFKSELRNVLGWKKAFVCLISALSERSVACRIVEIRRALGIRTACLRSGDGRRINRADIGQIRVLPDTQVQIRRGKERYAVLKARRGGWELTAYRTLLLGLSGFPGFQGLD